MNFAACTYGRQHELCRSKDWPSSKRKLLKILKPRYLSVSEICTMMGNRTASSIFIVWARARLVCEKVVGPNPTSPTACYGHGYASIQSAYMHAYFTEWRTLPRISLHNTLIHNPTMVSQNLGTSLKPPRARGRVWFCAGGLEAGLVRLYVTL